MKVDGGWIDLNDFYPQIIDIQLFVGFSF